MKRFYLVMISTAMSIFLSGVCMAQEPLPISSEEQRRLAFQELTAITILRSYIEAQKQYYTINYERGYCPSVGPLVKMELLESDFSVAFTHTNSGKTYFGYIFEEDIRINDPTKELGLYAVPDIYGVGGIHVFWIGDDEIVYEFEAKGKYGESPEKPDGIQSPLISKNGWRKVTDPISASVAEKSDPNSTKNEDSEKPEED